VLRRFNRETAYLALGLLAVLFCTAVALATLVTEQYSKTADVKEPTRQGQSGPLLNANPATLLGDGRFAMESTSQETSGTAVGVIQGSAESRARMKAVAAPTPIPVLALIPQ
jgi:hypothetical protein